MDSPSPQSAVAAGGGGVGLSEALEDMGEEVGVNAFAGVGYREFEVGVDAFEDDDLEILPPRGVNLMALVSRFQMSCCRRPASPAIRPVLGSRTVVRRRPFTSAEGRTDCTAWETTSAEGQSLHRVEADFPRNDPAHVQKIFNHLSSGLRALRSMASRPCLASSESSLLVLSRSATSRGSR